MAQVTALATGIGAREHQEVGGAAVLVWAADGRRAAAQGNAIGGEGAFNQQLFHHRMAAGLDQQLAPGRDLGPAIAAGGGHLGQGGEGIEVGHQPGRGPDRRGLGAHLAAQFGKQFKFPLGGAGLELQDPAFAALELGGHEALLVGQGLAADPVLRHGPGLGPAHREEVAKGAVVLQAQGGDAAGPAFAGLLLGQPGVLVIELVAQAIEAAVDAIVDQAPFGEGQGRRVHQAVAHQGRQLGQVGPGPGQGHQGWTAGLGQQGGQLGEPFEPIGQGHQVPGGGAASACPAGKPLQVAHGPQQPAQGLAQGALAHQFAHPLLAGADGGPIDQGRLDPAAQAAAAHGRDGAIQGPQQGPLHAPAQLGAGEFQVAAGLGIEHQLVARMPGGG